MIVAVRPAPARTHEVTVRTSPLDVILTLLALGFAALGLRPLKDPDVWWHLRTGELVLESGFTTTDPWSHASTNPWLLHEWAAQVLMYVSYWLGGYRGVIVLHALAMLALAVLLLRSIRAVGTPAISAAIGFVALVGVFLGSAERPQLASLCLLAAVLPALRRAVSSGAPPWWFVPVIAVWANIHGLWAAAIVIYGCLTLGLILDVGVWNWQKYRSFVLVGIASLAAASLNPSGPALLLAPLHVREYARFVGEWNPPGLLNPFFGASYLLVAIVITGWARDRRIVTWTEVAFVLGSCCVSLPYIRTMPILAIALAPLAASILNQRGESTRSVIYRQNWTNLALSTGLTISACLLAALWIPQVPPVARHAPWEASSQLDALPGRARVLNEYTLGGWLLWTARDTSPAIDGRTEIYSPEYVTAALTSVDAGPGWMRFIRENQFSAVWIRNQRPLKDELRDLGWKIRFRDEDSVILVPGDR